MTYDQLQPHVQKVIELAAEQQAVENNRKLSIASVGDRSGVTTAMATDAVDPDKQKQYFQWIDQLYQPWYELPDPASYQGAIDDLAAAITPLCTDAQNATNPIDKQAIVANVALSHIDGDYLSSWTGQAAVNFKRNFLDPFKMVANNQFLLMCCLKGALEAQQAMWKSVRNDIDNIATKTADVLNNMGRISESDGKYDISVLAAVAAIGLTFVTEGTSTVIYLTALSAAANSGSALFAGVDAKSDDDKKKAEQGAITGSTAAEVTKSMKDQVNQLQQHVIDTEKAVEQKLQAMISTINSNKNYFVSDGSSLANFKNGGLDSQAGLGTDE